MAPDMKNQTRTHILGGLLQFNTSAEHGQQIPMQCQVQQLVLINKETIYNIITYKTIQINWLLRNYGQMSLH